MRAFTGNKQAVERKQAAIDKALGLPRCECGNAVLPNQGGKLAPCPGADDTTGPDDPACKHVTETHRRPIKHPSRNEYALQVDDTVRGLSRRTVDVGGAQETIDVADAIDLGPDWFPDDDI